MRYPVHTIRYVQHLRVLGSTYNEINNILGVPFAKATLSDWCRHLPLSPEHKEKVRLCNVRSWKKARSVSLANRKKRREEFNSEITERNIPISHKILDKDIAKIALAMLCLGEASKSRSKGPFSLGNSDPKIISLFLMLLKQCFPFKPTLLRGRIQCRADQDTKALMKFWIKLTGIPEAQFYPTYIDKRSYGSPTLKREYKGVLSITYLDKKIQLELESLAEMIYNQVSSRR